MMRMVSVASDFGLVSVAKVSSRVELHYYQYTYSSLVTERSLSRSPSGFGRHSSAIVRAVEFWGFVRGDRV